MRAKRVDTNHAALVSAFRELGCSVLDLSAVGKGCPDLAIGINSVTALVEVKRDSKAKFTEPQLEFMKNWKGGAVARIENEESAKWLVNTMKAAK